MGSNLLTVKEACLILRVHRNTVYKMIHDGRLQAFKVGRAWRIPKDDSLHWQETIKCLSELTLTNHES